MVFIFSEFISNWLSNDDSLNMDLCYNDDLHLIRKGNDLWAKEIINIYYHSKYTVAYSKPSYRDITSSSFNYADFPPLWFFTSHMANLSNGFHLFLLKVPLLILLTLNNPWSFLVTLIFQLLLKSLLPSLFWNPIILSFH